MAHQHTRCQLEHTSHLSKTLQKMKRPALWWTCLKANSQLIFQKTLTDLTACLWFSMSSRFSQICFHCFHSNKFTGSELKRWGLKMMTDMAIAFLSTSPFGVKVFIRKIPHSICHAVWSNTDQIWLTLQQSLQMTLDSLLEKKKGKFYYALSPLVPGFEFIKTPRCLERVLWK